MEGCRPIFRQPGRNWNRNLGCRFYEEIEGDELKTKKTLIRYPFLTIVGSQKWFVSDSGGMNLVVENFL